MNDDDSDWLLVLWSVALFLWWGLGSPAPVPLWYRC